MQLVAVQTSRPTARIRCDRGSNFVGAKSELEQALEEMDEGEVKTYSRIRAANGVSIRHMHPILEESGSRKLGLSDQF